MRKRLQKAVVKLTTRFMMFALSPLLFLLIFVGIVTIDTSNVAFSVYTTSSIYRGNILRNGSLHNFASHIPPNELFNVEKFKTQVKTCLGDIWYTASICDHTGICQVTGIAKRSKRHVVASILDVVIPSATGEPLPIFSKKIIWSNETHGKAYSTFRAFFQVTAKDTPNIKYMLADNCLKEDQTRMPIPVDFRMKEFNGKLVLIVSQYFNNVKLSWISIFLKHYLNIGVDYIALYTTFKAWEDNYDAKYEENFQKLLAQPVFKDHIIRFNFSAMACLDSWAKAQVGVINHGATLFFGSTIMSLDLDEIIIPKQHNTLIPFILQYNQRYGNWAGHFHPFKLDVNFPLKHLAKTFDLNYNFTRLMKKSKSCGLPSKVRKPLYPCRAKWIYHSLDMAMVETHECIFSAPVYQETWLNEKLAIDMHIRGFQKYHRMAHRPRNIDNEYEDFDGQSDSYLTVRKQNHST